ncbi:MAG: ATP-binding protein [Ignavibacteriales bacterium]
MRLEKMRVNGFGKITEKEIELNRNLNIVYGSNESGKSTIQAFIKAMLFGLGKNLKAGIPEKERFRPWKSREYGGMLEYSLDNLKKFSIWRDFGSNQVKVSDSGYKDITNEFDKSKAGGVLFAQEHLGINSVMFESTCFISQLGIRLDSERELLMSDKITNMLETGNENVSYIQAVKALEKALIEEVGTDRTSERPLNKIRERIHFLEKERASFARILERTRVLEEELEELKRNELVLKHKFMAVEALCNGIKTEQKLKSIQSSDNRIGELKYNLEQKKSEISQVLRNIPSGSAVFDEDVANHLTKLQSEIGKIVRKFSLLFGGGMGMLVYVLGRSIVMRDFLITDIILEAAALIIIIVGIALYIKPLITGKSEVRDILSAGSVKTISEYFEKKKEIQFLLEKKGILEESAEIIRSQIGSIYEENKSIPDSGESYKNIDIQGIPDNIIEEIKLIQSSEVEAYSKETINQLRKAELKINGVETEIKILSEQASRLPEIEEQLEGERQEELKLKEFAWCLTKAKKILDESSQELKNNTTPELSNRISSTVYDLTRRYNHVKADAGGQGIKIILEDGNVIPPELLSGGTIDQVYFALRVAGIQMLSENGETLPLIIDEPFSQFDDDRIKLTAQMLGRISEKNQVIIFTCRQNEVDLFLKEVPSAQLIRL